MSVLLKKTNGYSRTYSSASFPALDSNWTGSASLYQSYPGTAIATYPLTRVGNTFTLLIPLVDIMNFSSGLYYFVTTITNSVLGVEVDMLEYATVADATIFTEPMTKLFITLGKIDGTPAGRQTKTMINGVNGAVVTLGWEGLTITISHPKAIQNSGGVIDTETTSMTTNQAGYAEAYVVKGQTVIVSCPGFDAPVTVNTTGLDTVDLSTLFPTS